MHMQVNIIEKIEYEEVMCQGIQLWNIDIKDVKKQNHEDMNEQNIVAISQETKHIYQY